MQKCVHMTESAAFLKQMSTRDEMAPHTPPVLRVCRVLFLCSVVSRVETAPSEDKPGPTPFELNKLNTVLLIVSLLGCDSGHRNTTQIHVSTRRGSLKSNSIVIRKTIKIPEANG